jgi:hypothetical protein
LLEEGNAFEAEVVMGVEDAEDNGEREVRTHEVPEDDVPAEYPRRGPSWSNVIPLLICLAAL